MKGLSHHVRWRTVFAIAIVASLACTACNRNTAVPTGAAAAASAFLDAGQGAGFTYHIAYPPLPAAWGALDRAIREFGAAQKHDLVASVPGHTPDRTASTLDLSFDIARRTSGFVSVLTRGEVFTGGAHGRPIVASFNLDLASGHLVDVAALFADASIALQALSAECRRQLQGRLDARTRDAESGLTPALRASEFTAAKQWIDKGTAPRAENFRVFLVDGLDAPAIGLTLIFPPDQVGPYADGVQQVEVPAAVFYALLKAEYRDAFAIDTQAARRN